MRCSVHQATAGCARSDGGSTALVTARQNGSFTEVHEAFWAAARATHADAAGTRALIEVVLLHRRMPAAAVEQGVAAAIRGGATSADVVAVEAHRAAAQIPPPEADLDDADEPPPWAEPSGVVSLTARRAQPPEDRRPLPTVAHHNQLLTRQPRDTACRDRPRLRFLRPAVTRGRRRPWTRPSSRQRREGPDAFEPGS